MKPRLKLLIALEIIKPLRDTCEPKQLLSSSRKLLASLGVIIILGSTAAGFTGVNISSEQKEVTLGLANSLSQRADYGNQLSFEEFNSDEVHVYFGMQPRYARAPSGNDRIQLVNSKNAADPTWEQLKTFLLTDKTEQKYYDPISYPCGAYAEEVHNNAEAAGIKAAWVAVEFEDEKILHALNVFHTTDGGLVWVDCTNLWPNSYSCDDVYSQDKVAYVAVGKEYGLVSMNDVSSFDYAAYEEYVQKRLDYERLSRVYYQKAKEYIAEVQKYDELASLQMGQISAGKTNIVPGCYEQLEMERARLDMLRESVEKIEESLGPFWSTLGTVSSVEIYW